MAIAELTESQMILADSFWKTEAFKVAGEGGGFKLKLHEKNPEAPLSPYYISMRGKDVKPGTYDWLMEDIAHAMYWENQEILKNRKIRHVVGIPKAANRIAEILGIAMGIDVMTMDKVEDDSGRHISSTVNGEFKSGDGILGVDDLVSAADTKFEFSAGLKDNGLSLVHLAVALDREQGGMQKLREAGISVSAVLTVSQLLDHYLLTDYINNSTYDRIRTYIDS